MQQVYNVFCCLGSLNKQIIFYNILTGDPRLNSATLMYMTHLILGMHMKSTASASTVGVCEEALAS
jgi:hypothetical protein